MMKKKYVILFLVCTIVTLLPVVSGAAEPNASVTISSSGNNVVGTELRGVMNWDRGVVQAIGIGVPPAQIGSQAQANAMSRRAAIVDAYRNLLEAVGEVRVDAMTTVKNFELEKDIVKTRISGIIQGAKIVNAAGKLWLP